MKKKNNTMTWCLERNHKTYRTHRAYFLFSLSWHMWLTHGASHDAFSSPFHRVERNFMAIFTSSYPWLTVAKHIDDEIMFMSACSGEWDGCYSLKQLPWCVRRKRSKKSPHAEEARAISEKVLSCFDGLVHSPADIQQLDTFLWQSRS